MPGANPADALKQISKELQEKFDEAGMGEVEDFVDKLDDLVDKIKKGPAELVKSAEKQFSELKENLEKGWALIQRPGGEGTGVKMDPPTPVGKYLGCDHIVRNSVSLITGKPIRHMEYDMSSFLHSCVQVYRNLSGWGDAEIKPARKILV